MKFFASIFQKSRYPTPIHPHRRPVGSRSWIFTILVKKSIKTQNFAFPKSKYFLKYLKYTSSNFQPQRTKIRDARPHNAQLRFLPHLLELSVSPTVPSCRADSVSKSLRHVPTTAPRTVSRTVYHLSCEHDCVGSLLSNRGCGVTASLRCIFVLDTQQCRSSGNTSDEACHCRQALLA